MFSTTIAAGSVLAKRVVEEPSKAKELFAAVPFLLLLANLIVLVPILVILGYTLGHVYPVLAAVEDPLPDYEAVSMADDDLPKDSADQARTAVALPGKPITASIRRILRLLRSNGGGTWRGLLRGLGYAWVIGILTAVTTTFFALAPFIPIPVASLLALLAVAPLTTAWTHFIITPPPTAATPRTLFNRIPPIRKVYAATWLPTTLLWLATHAAVYLPLGLAALIGLQDSKNQPNQHQPIRANASDAAKVICVAGVSLGLQALLVIPAHAALTRVQASLLPADEPTIVPFDRSFAGLVEPEVVTGKGFATFGAAIKTVTLASWGRIYLLRVKVFAFSFAVCSAMVAFIMLEMGLLTLVAGRK
ncbi:hypothetical protein C8A05DRAFT_15937 [Staphylotrichum tortipilum]|uniref:Ubiquitin carrier protein n=1 Tax=Staphylotrichum tortipilum TaxID=2831512 RepID=A0AAN6MJA1_9PEZI|nr:hypothetical protein C8A05DRAFT_15937 [Staphylotrichum longicolle]